MDKLFNSNNPFWSGMDKIFDIFVLNVLWLVSCIPIITIGPSTAAFFYAMMNLMDNEEHYVSKDFFGFLKENFKSTFKTGIVLTAIDLFLLIDIYLCYRSGTGIYTFFMVFFFVILLVMFFITTYAYALLAKFKKDTKDIILWAFVLSIRHIWKSFLILFLFIFGLWVCHILPGLVFIIAGLVGALQALIFLRILKPYLQDAQKDVNDEDISI